MRFIYAGTEFLLFLISHVKAIPARISIGIIAKLTVDHPSCGEPPEQFISPPEVREASVTDPKIIKSLVPWTTPRSLLL